MNKENKSNGEERVPFKMNVTERPKLSFEGKTSFTFADNGTEPITAATFGARVNNVFKAVFEDMDGCYFETTNNRFTYSLLFDHDKHPDDARLGVTSEVSKIGASNNRSINRLRNFDRNRTVGTKFSPTQDLIDVVTPLLIPQAFNKNKPNWGNIVTDFAENRTIYSGYQYSSPVYTKVKDIDLNKLWKFVMGDKDENGNNIEWIVNPIHPYSIPQYRNIPFNNLRPEHWHFSVTCINTANAENTFKLFGLSTGESNIIR